MRRFIRMIYIIGLLFYGGGILFYSLAYISLDGIGPTGLVSNADNANIELSQDSQYIYIDYTFYVEKKEFQNRSKVWKDVYEKSNTDRLTVKYNKLFPDLNYIEQVPIERRSYKLGAITFSIIFLFAFLLWNLSDREKWFRKYESIGSVFSNNRGIRKN